MQKETTEIKEITEDVTSVIQNHEEEARPQLRIPFVPRNKAAPRRRLDHKGVEYPKTEDDGRRAKRDDNGNCIVYKES